MVAVVDRPGLLVTIDETTPLSVLGVVMAVLGLGLGATMQNLVLAVQNNTAQADMGAASSLVAFFRSLGGSIGVSALGAVLSHQVADAGDHAASPRWGCRRTATRATPSPTSRRCPAPVRALFEQAFGEATGHLFLVAAAVRGRGPGLRAVHPRGAAAHDDPAARMRSRRPTTCAEAEMVGSRAAR